MVSSTIKRLFLLLSQLVRLTVGGEREREREERQSWFFRSFFQVNDINCLAFDCVSLSRLPIQQLLHPSHHQMQTTSIQIDNKWNSLINKCDICWHNKFMRNLIKFTAALERRQIDSTTVLIARDIEG